MRVCFRLLDPLTAESETGARAEIVRPEEMATQPVRVVDRIGIGFYGPQGVYGCGALDGDVVVIHAIEAPGNWEPTLAEGR